MAMKIKKSGSCPNISTGDENNENTRKISTMKKKNDDKHKVKRERFLITINVFGSAGPIRFVVNDDDEAAVVIGTALKMYAREERLPILGCDIDSFFLYPANAGFDALKPSEAIGSQGVRNFVLCKKENKPNMTEMRSEVINKKGSGWQAWLRRSLSLKILPH